MSSSCRKLSRSWFGEKFRSQVLCVHCTRCSFFLWSILVLAYVSLVCLSCFCWTTSDVVRSWYFVQHIASHNGHSNGASKLLQKHWKCSSSNLCWPAETRCTHSLQLLLPWSWQQSLSWNQLQVLQTILRQVVPVDLCRIEAGLLISNGPTTPFVSSPITSLAKPLSSFLNSSLYSLLILAALLSSGVVMVSHVS